MIDNKPLAMFFNASPRKVVAHEAAEALSPTDHPLGRAHDRAVKAHYCISCGAKYATFCLVHKI